MPNNEDTAERIGKVEAHVEEIFRQLQDMKTVRSEMNAYLTNALERLDQRTRAVERYIWIGIGALGALQILIAWIKK